MLHIHPLEKELDKTNGRKSVSLDLPTLNDDVL